MLGDSRLSVALRIVRARPVEAALGDCTSLKRFGREEVVDETVLRDQAVRDGRTIHGICAQTSSIACNGTPQ